MNAERSDLIFRPAFAAFILSFLFFCLCAVLTGCSPARNLPRSDQITTLPARDALEAGSMALYMQGLLYESSTNAIPEQAAEAYAGALVLNPHNLSALSSLVNTLSQQKRYEEGFAALTRYLVNFPDNTELHYYAVKLAEHLKKPALAAQYCRQILRSDPTNQPVAQAAILYSFEAGSERKALATMRQFAGELDKEEALQFSLGTILAIYPKLQNPAQALKCCRIALQFAQTAPEKSDVMMVQAYCQLEAGQTNNAVRTFKASYALNPQNYIPLAHLGVIYATQPALLHALEKKCAAEQVDRIPPPELILGYAYRTLEQPGKAADFFEKYYRSRMRRGYFADKEFYLLLGSFYESDKAYAKIDALFNDALCAYPDDPEILNFAAYLWAERSIRLDQALRLINTALKQEPDNPAFLDTKGWILHKLGRNFEALQLLLKACAAENQEPVILDHTGDVLYAIGIEILALDFWTKSYLNDPQQSVADKLTRLGEPLPQR